MSAFPEVSSLKTSPEILDLQEPRPEDDPESFPPWLQLPTVDQGPQAVRLLESQTASVQTCEFTHCSEQLHTTPHHSA